MAQNSISRLAIHIITDTKGMMTGFESAKQQTQRFSREVEKSNATLSKLGRVGADAAKSFGGTGGLAFKLGGAAGPIGLAAASVGAMAIGLARLADSAEDFRIEKLREVGALGPEVKTTTELFAAFKEQLSSFAELSGFSMKPILGELKEAARAANVLIFGEDAVRNLERQNAEARTAMERFKEKKQAEEEAAKAAKAAADEARRQQEELRKRGEDVASSLRTPFEIFKDTLNELVELQRAGAISGEILGRGIDQASEKYRKASTDVKQLKNELKAVPALELGTQAARTAMLSARSNPAASAEQIRLEKEQAALQKRIAEATEAALTKPAVTFKKGEM